MTKPSIRPKLFLASALLVPVASFALSTTLLGAQQSTETPNATPTFKDRTQWRKLQRHMSKDDVKKLLGDPFRVSVSHYYESWDYLGGTVTFDSKGHLDFWSES
jgi:outer membrane protein assembly factor BamE (lipoprotein component of BamABCDE complex)